MHSKGEAKASPYFYGREKKSMNYLETLAITIIMGALQQAVKNPAHKAAMQTQLVGVATDILESYGYSVTAPTGS